MSYIIGDILISFKDYELGWSVSMYRVETDKTLHLFGYNKIDNDFGVRMGAFLLCTNYYYV